MFFNKLTALLISNLLWHVDANDVVVVLDAVVVADGVAVAHAHVVVAVGVAVAAIGCYWLRHWDRIRKMTSFGHWPSQYLV